MSLRYSAFRLDWRRPPSWPPCRRCTRSEPTNRRHQRDRRLLRGPTGRSSPFKIQVPNTALTDLKQRLANARFADEFPDANWDYGMNLGTLKTLIDYWRDHVRLARAREASSTRSPSSRRHRWRRYSFHPPAIDQPECHSAVAAERLAKLHPRYAKVIGPLTDPAASGGRAEDSFHVVIPSMPGFGFSGKPRERGYDPERIAGIWVQLMARLGYSRYATHGSDWGSGIATRVALADSAHVIGLHLAGCGGGAGPAAAAANPSTNANVNGAHNLGYQEIQSTKPQTLGHGLSDSPVGLASWIVEKWYGWSDHDGDLDKAFTKDEPPDQRDDLLGDEQRHLVGAHLLREPAHGRASRCRNRRSYRPGAGDRSDRLRSVSLSIPTGGQRQPNPNTEAARKASRDPLQHRAFHYDAPWRPFPGVRAAHPVG